MTFDPALLEQHLEASCEASGVPVAIDDPLLVEQLSFLMRREGAA